MTEEERLLLEQESIMLNRSSGMEEDEAVKAQMDYTFGVGQESPKLIDKIKQQSLTAPIQKSAPIQEPARVEQEPIPVNIESPEVTPEEVANYPQLPKSPEQELAEARSLRNRNEALANMGKYLEKASYANAGAGLANYKADSSYFEDAAKKAGRPLSELLADRKAKSKKEIDEMKKTILGDQVEMSSKDSKIANTKRKLMESKYRDSLGGQSLEGLSVNQLKEIESMVKESGKGLSPGMMLRIQEMQANRKLRKDQFDYRQDDKKKRELETDTQKFGNKAANIQKFVGALDNVEDKLGFKLEDAVIKDGKVLINGKESDLPGVSVKGLGRLDLFQDDAQQLESAMAKVFNTIIKDRSGAAVTTDEILRLKMEFGKGSYNTEAQMIQALQDYRKLVVAELKNREASYGKKVVDNYRSQGGLTSKDLGSKSKKDSKFKKELKPGFTRMVDSKGKVRQIPTSRVDEAINDKDDPLKVME